MKDCVIYSRVSTKGQDFESQTEDLTKYAEYTGYSVARVFGEIVSGFNQDVERVEYDRMKEYVISNGIKHILIWELSRLSRNTAFTLNEIKFFSENGINVYFKKENLNTLSD